MILCMRACVGVCVFPSALMLGLQMVYILDCVFERQTIMNLLLMFGLIFWYVHECTVNTVVSLQRWRTREILEKYCIGNCEDCMEAPNFS